MEFKIKTDKRAEGAGFTIGQVLKIVIAVAVIIALFYFAFKMYGIFSTSTRMEQAKTNLDELIAKINSVKEGEKINHLITGPKDWHLIYFSEQSPSKCGNFKCICICDENSKESCDKEGVCKAVDDNLKFMIQYFGESYISLDVLRSIFIEKINNEIILSTDEKGFSNLPALFKYLKKNMTFNNEEKNMEAWIISFDGMSEKDFKNIESSWSDLTKEFFNKEPGGNWAIQICYPAGGLRDAQCWINLVNSNGRESAFYFSSSGGTGETYTWPIRFERGNIELKLRVLK